MTTRQGAGLELLGTILAVCGWSFAALTGWFTIRGFVEASRFGVPGEAFAALLFALVSGLVGSLALAGLGHLLRAVAQMGRNMHRLAALVRETRPPG